MDKAPPTERPLTGRIAADRIRTFDIPRPGGDVVARFAALGHATGVISDVMDELGIPSGVVGAGDLKPTCQGSCIVGPALTVRNIMRRINPLEGARAKANGMAEFEAHNLARPGDVLVIAGVDRVSNMGGISAQLGRRQGEIGAVVWGGVRDVHHSRAVGYPVWARDVTPVTGKWRIEAVEINGPVQISDVRVEAGDLVMADDTGVCFMPRNALTQILERAEAKVRAEAQRCAAIDAGESVPALSEATYGEGRGRAG